MLLLFFISLAQLPPTPAGKQLADWLEVFAKGDQQAGHVTRHRLSRLPCIRQDVSN